MSLATGTVLGAYRIEGPLGAGGMGEVYKAVDTRLERTVAIKVLPQHLADDDNVRQRFAREAKAISSLTHPNICTLYDIGNEGGIYFLVMEYIDGETVATRLEKGPLDKDLAIKTAIEIADALDKAHRQGFIHRDLKPGNIMLTKSGAKLLDFGLARPTQQEAGEHDLTQSPTLSQPLTAEGAIVGTFQYMAPEQLEGVEADARTDIFAFGATLYEVITGQKAFSGKTQASLIASILKEEPRDISQLQPMTPPALERVVKRCLAKDPDDRWQTTRDLMLELQWIRDGSSSTAGTPAPVRRKRKSRERIAWAIAAVAVGAAGVLAWMNTQRPVATREVGRYEVQLTGNLTPVPAQPEMSLAPDGKHLAFTATNDEGVTRLWVRALDSREIKPLVGTETGYLPFWSFDSREVACFRRSDTKLIRVAIDGGTPKVICDAPDGRGGTWSKDDVILFAPTSSGPLYRVHAGGGVPQQVTRIDTTGDEQGHRWPSFLPDGRHFFYVALPGRDNTFAVYAGSLDDDTSEFLLNATGVPVYAPEGYILYERDQALVAQRFDAASRQLTGEPIAVGEEPGSQGGWSAAPSVSVSQTGVLARVAWFNQDTRLYWLDYQGRLLDPVDVPSGVFGFPGISPDGKYAAVPNFGAGPTSDIWTVELSRGVAQRFSFHQSLNDYPVWSADSRRIVFSSDRLGKESLVMKSLDGGDEEILLNQPALFAKPDDWSRDGRYLIYNVLVPETGTDLYVMEVDGDRQPIPYLVTRFNEIDPAISPDGKWVCYRSDESGTLELYVQSFPTAGSKYRVSLNGAGSNIGNGWLTGWAPDGSMILWAAPDGRTIMGADVHASGSRFEAASPTELFKTTSTRLGIALDPTQERLLVVSPVNEMTPAFYIATDWAAALAD